MDLKTFAVHRKLAFDDPLLSYVARQEAIPVAVAEKSFEKYLTPLTDKQSESLIADYKSMLGEEVPVVIRRNPKNGGYDVSGDIPDTLVEAIGLVHNVAPDEVVAALVDYNLETVHGQTCEILSTTLGEQAKRTRLAVEAVPEVVGVAELMEDTSEAIPDEVQEGVSTVMPDKAAAAVSGSVLDETLESGDMPETVTEEPSESLPEAMAETIPEEQPEDMPDDLFSQDMPDTISEDTMGDGIPEGPVMEPAVEEDLYSGPTDPEQADDFAATIRNIYNKFCADLRSYGLDKRLKLAM